MKPIRWLIKAFPIAVGVMLAVALGFATLGRIQRVVEAPGEVRVERFQVVRPQVSGLVMEVRAEAGDLVREGQVLFRLRDHQFERELSSTRQSLEEARSRLKRLRQEHELKERTIHPLEIDRQRAAIARGTLEGELAASIVKEAEVALEAVQERHRQARALAEAGLISQQQLQERRQEELAAEQRLVQARIQERTARMEEPALTTDLRLLSSEQHRELTGLEAEIHELEAGVAKATALLEQLQGLQKLHVLRAGMDGVLVGASSTPDLMGQYVEAGQDLLTIVDVASIQFWTRVPEQALVQVRSGQQARLEIAGLPKDQFQLFSGQVERVFLEPDLDASAGAPTYGVQIRLHDPWLPLKEGRFYLRSGMRGTARIAYGRDVPILRAFYEFLVSKPQLPDSPPKQPAVVTTQDRLNDHRHTKAERPQI